MDKFEENHIKIANYLDNLMSAAEEESFMQELSNDADLRKQYEEELIISELLRHEKIESDDPVKIAPVILFWRKYKVVAVVLAIFISIGLIYLASLNEKDKHTEISQGTAPTVDSTSRKQDTVTLIKNIAEKSFAKFYKPYSGEKDPVEISNYYNDYKQHNYDAVIKAKESDYQTMGTGDKNEILKRYMHLYKGLSWLELNEPETALEQFAAISKSSLEDRRPYYESQWYSVLAWLKGNDITKAREQAKEIIKTKSPHNFDAEKFLRQY